MSEQLIKETYSTLVNNTIQMRLITFLEMAFNFVILLGNLNTYMYFLPFIFSYIGWNGFLYYRSDKITIYIIGHFLEIIYSFIYYTNKQNNMTNAFSLLVILCYNCYVIINSIKFRSIIININNLIQEYIENN